MISTVRCSAWTALVLAVAAPAAIGLHLRQVTGCCPGGATDWRLSQPTLSPDGRVLAYCDESQYSATDKPPSFIQTLTLRGTPAAGFLLPPHAWGRLVAPAWSPSGNRMAFVCESTNPEHAGLWVTERAASNAPPALTRWVSGGDAREPAWLPDGRSLVYVSDGSLWRVSGPGATGERIPIPGTVASPSCATGGIAYSRADHVWIYDGERDRQLTFGNSVNAMPALSLDGEWIVFVSDRAGNPDLWVISAGGGTAVRITDDAAQEIDPVWSAVGDELAYVSWRGGSPNVWLATALPRFTTGVTDGSWSRIRATYRP